MGDAADDDRLLEPARQDMSAYRIASGLWIGAGLLNLGVGWLIGVVMWQVIGLVGLIFWLFLAYFGAPVWPSEALAALGVYLPMVPLLVVPSLGVFEVIVGIVGVVWPGRWLRWLPILCVFSCVFFDAFSLLAGLTSGLLLWRAAVRAQRRDRADSPA